MKPFLILQLRPEAEASDNEYEAILQKAGLRADETLRIRLDQTAQVPEISQHAFSGVIVGGGPGCVSDAPEKKSAIEQQIEAAVLGVMPSIVAQDFPFLGCCYGIGVLGHHLGAAVNKSRFSEVVGTAECSLTREGQQDPLLAGMPDQFEAFVGHKEALQELPRGCALLASAPTCPFQMIRHGSNVYATQFHPEADSQGFELRIRIYRKSGYFPPDDATRLIGMCRSANVFAPERILRNFVARYRRARP